MIVPVSAAGEVISLAHESVGAPRHEVPRARLNRERAAWAQVPLRCGGGRERLHLPDAVALIVSAESAEQRTRKRVFWLVVFRATARMI